MQGVARDWGGEANSQPVHGDRVSETSIAAYKHKPAFVSHVTIMWLKLIWSQSSVHFECVFTDVHVHNRSVTCLESCDYHVPLTLQNTPQRQNCWLRGCWTWSCTVQRTTPSSMRIPLPLHAWQEWSPWQLKLLVFAFVDMLATDYVLAAIITLIVARVIHTHTRMHSHTHTHMHTCAHTHTHEMHSH